MKKNVRILSLVSTFLLVIGSAANAKTIYVDADRPPGGGGTSWANAYNYLQDALADANSSAKPVEVRVAQGTYKPDEGAGVTDGNREATFALMNSVTLKGGYAGFGQPDPDARDPNSYATVLSGDLTDNDALFIGNEENSYHVVTASGTDGTAVLDGVTITAGNADGSAPDDTGGGIYADSGSPTLTNCTFTINSANGDAGGIYNCDGQIANCLVHDNRSVSGSGGAFSNCDGSIINCTIAFNMAASGAGGLSDCSGTIANCIIWFDIPAELYNCSQPTYSGILNWAGGGTGNINLTASPFVVSQNYHLDPCSPCINAGDNAAVPAGVTTDLDGKPRIIDGIVDMGVYEYGSATLPFQKNQVEWPDDPFVNRPSEGDAGFVKFAIMLDDPCTVIFNDSQEYPLHYDFAVNWLEPFIGMTLEEYFDAVLYEEGQLASIGSVFMPPISGVPPTPEFDEYGIEFVRQDPYTKEQIRDMFNVVKANVIAGPGVEAFYFPTFMQKAVAQANAAWFESEGIIVSSFARWYEGNIGYSYGWAMGRLKYVAGTEIQTAYTNGDLLPTDILLSDGIPAEIPYVAGVLSLSPVTPSSHVVILARTNLVPVVYLGVPEDANLAQQLVGCTVFMAAEDVSGICELTLMDVNDRLTEQQVDEILELKKPPPLDISPIAYCGSYSEDTTSLLPTDINNFGGKSSNFGILRTSIPNDSPVAVGFSFNVWDDFLDQQITPRDGITIDPCGYELFWADDEQGEGPTHTDFRLSKSGEDIGLFDIDGATLIDGITFGAQIQDVSYGRSPDGNDNWAFFSGGDITPRSSNAAGSSPNEGLFINEFMADNDHIVQDEAGDYDDWLEIYNAGPEAIDLGGMYLTDDMNDPTEWMIPFDITGSTLRQEISSRLSNYPNYPPSDMAALSADLHKIRSMFRDPAITGFSQQVYDAVIATLTDPQYGFDPYSKLRFRSSTNVEDSSEFTGAGLYDSYSGCLADDLDGDEFGPCNCDPCQSNERSVFRAIRRTLASFYNDNAFLERLRYSVNEPNVGMAILSHHSFPDEIELANGVAVVRKESGSAAWHIELVSQPGAISVTNPPLGTIPEEVSVVYTSPNEIELTLDTSSNRVPAGAKVMEWPSDYEDLSELLVTVANRYSVVKDQNEYLLDLEYKKVDPGGAVKPEGGLVIKQVRPIPEPNDAPSIIPFLMNEPAQYSIFAGEYRWGDLTEDVFANHRLKCRFDLETEFYRLEPNDLNSTSFYADANMEYLDGNTIYNYSGLLPSWPGAYHSFDGNDTNDGWLFDHLPNPRAYELRSENIPGLVTAIESPLFTLSDLGSQPLGLGEKRFTVLMLNVDYNEPVLRWDQGAGCITTTTTNKAHIWRCPQPSPDDVLRTYTFTGGPDNVNITTSYYHPPPPLDLGWEMVTAPLARFVETTITGYTSTPIVLTGYYSQTYHPEHHNIKEHFIFEPRLEPGISQTILDELQAKDIRLIHLAIACPQRYEGGGACYGDLKGDLDGNNYVNSADFAAFAARWGDTGCTSPNWCNGTDLTGDGNVDGKDLAEFTEDWLKSAIMTHGFDE
jgi:hypothetical protein